MNKCPNCGEEIDYLYMEVSTVNEIEAINEDGEINFGGTIEVSEDLTNWCCPDCWEPIAENETEAKKFLNKSELEIKVEEVLNG